MIFLSIGNLESPFLINITTTINKDRNIAATIANSMFTSKLLFSKPNDVSFKLDDSEVFSVKLRKSFRYLETSISLKWTRFAKVVQNKLALAGKVI
jgi:hypothetical protein